MTDDGGPAFPSDSEGQISDSRWHFLGMTLRDYFAAKAMQALASKFEDAPDERIICAHYLARRSYEIADTMLEAREK